MRAHRHRYACASKNAPLFALRCCQALRAITNEFNEVVDVWFSGDKGIQDLDSHIAEIQKRQELRGSHGIDVLYTDCGCCNGHEGAQPVRAGALGAIKVRVTARP
jgi:hypothetical protein